jgi:two-component system cell cycle response regulator
MTTPRAVSPQRVLVIEDNAANLKLMVFLLKSFGLHPLAASSGGEGVRVALEERPDLILCDLQMPEVDGFQVLRLLDEAPGGRPAPVVAITAFAMVGDRERVLRAGFDGYLPKPINPATFAQQLEGFLSVDRAFANAHEMPASRGEVALRPVPAPASPRALVLAIDDTPWNLQLLRSVLQPHGFRVLTAASVTEGLAMAKEHRPDVILSDWHIADGNGDTLLAALRDDPLLRRVPLAFLSHSGEGVPRPRLEGARWLRRIADPRALVAQVEEMLGDTAAAPTVP